MSEFQLLLADTTLRGGEQASGVFFTLQEKLAIADLLDAAGVDIIDAGMPIVSKEDRKCLEALQARGYRATVAATVRALRADIDYALECGLDDVFLVMPVSSLHLAYRFGIDLQQAQYRIEAVVDYAIAKGLRVNFVAEDAVRASPQSLAPLFDQLCDLGVSSIIVCDTVGVMNPQTISVYVAKLRSAMDRKARLGVHCHNDYGLGTANVLAAVSAGCSLVVSSVNGLGERAGNAVTEEVVCALEDLYRVAVNIDRSVFTRLSETVARASGIFVVPTRPVVGYNAFRHESGAHVDGMLKDPSTYESLRPGPLGRAHEMSLGKHSGRALVEMRLAEKGISVSNAVCLRILERVKAARTDTDKGPVKGMAELLAQFWARYLSFSDTDFWKIVQEEMERPSFDTFHFPPTRFTTGLSGKDTIYRSTSGEDANLGPRKQKKTDSLSARSSRYFDDLKKEPDSGILPSSDRLVDLDPSSALGELSPSNPQMHCKEQRVLLGFSLPESPDSALSQQTLSVSTNYILWVDIAAASDESSLSEPSSSHASNDNFLDVIVFPFIDQLELTGPRWGRIEALGTGSHVTQHAWSCTAPSTSSTAKLYFPLRTPNVPGRHALRCNIYHRGVLLQSHLVRAQVTERAADGDFAFSSIVDYNLNSRLDLDCFSKDDECKVSIFINSDFHGTHSFRFVSSKNGVPESIGDSHVEGIQLAKMIDYARRALRWSTWGNDEPWVPGRSCKFSTVFNERDFSESIILMARRGANLWMQISASFSFVGPSAMALRERMRFPGRVQIAIKDSPDAVIPIALIYDYPFDPGRKIITICARALRAIATGAPLNEEACFAGECPNYEDRSIVCPGGFWGFRHELGLPLHLPRGEVATTIPIGSSLRAFAAISTDPALQLRDLHLADLCRIPEVASTWMEILRDRESCLARLKEARQLVYFYCHGGVTAAETPFLRVGDLESDDIFASSLVDAGISWPAPLRPLVFLNGCHTTAISPDAMFSMLTAFAAHCNAAAVIGTEITNFEAIADMFGRSFLRQFISGVPLGRAIRLSRLDLLRSGNPLGLMYIPFGLPSLRLQ